MTKRKTSKEAKKSKDSFRLCPLTGDKVWITTVTLKDMKQHAARTGGDDRSNLNKKKQLVRIPSQTEREKIYEKAARAMEAKEMQFLPMFGGRPWKVICRITESKGKKPPLFRWFRGELELACLPHLLEKIPDPPECKGKSRVQTPDPLLYVSKASLQERTISSLSNVAWNDLEYGLPNVTIKWLSPNHVYFYSRKAAWDNMTELAEQQMLLDRILLGYGARGHFLKPFKPTKAQGLQAGTLRFLRDGIWVVGQEETWQRERADWFIAEAKRKEMIMQSIGSKCQSVEGDAESNPEVQTDCTPGAGDTASTVEPPNENDVPNVGVVDVELEEPQAKRRPLSGLQYYLRHERERYRDEKVRELNRARLEGKATIGDVTATTLREAETQLRNVWKSLDDEERMTWKLRAQQYELTQLEAVPVAMDPEAPKVESSNIDSTPTQESLSGDAITNSATVTVEGDQDLGPQDCAMEHPGESPASVNPSESTEPEAPKVESSNIDSTQTQESLSGDAITNSATVTVEGDQDLAPQDCAMDNPDESPASVNPSENVSISSALPTTQVSLTISSEDHISLVSPSPPLACLYEDDHCEAIVECTPDASPCGKTSPSENMTMIQSDSSVPIPEEPPSGGNDESAVSGDQDEKVGETLLMAPGPVPTVLPPIKRRRNPSTCPPRQISPSVHWRLKQEHIDLCYASVMEHYDTVMNTVKARALHSELQDGFDVLRERGRGRYDMELAIFDSAAFSFLTDIHEAPWMPIVRQILGDDVVLIHKGSFLSMPGAEAQNYHQDGPHLTTKSQRPCHAVNVFIPLVDLHSRNGPTEFCLGSHILGHDEYDRKRIETPHVPAGTPVIFDYRLGHRGMANSSPTCRPIVYCTYAASANGKEFRDSVNFSRKRYHAIGELVDKPLSRDERVKRRKRSLDQRALDTGAPDAHEKPCPEIKGDEAPISLPLS